MSVQYALPTAGGDPLRDGPGPGRVSAARYLGAPQSEPLLEHDRTLPLRADSHGYGAAIPEASAAIAVTLTFLDDAGRELGSKRLMAPVG